MIIILHTYTESYPLNNYIASYKHFNKNFLEKLHFGPQNRGYSQ